VVSLVVGASGHGGRDVADDRHGPGVRAGDEREQAGEALALVARVADELDRGAVRRRHDGRDDVTGGRDDVTGRQVPAVARDDRR